MIAPGRVFFFEEPRRPVAIPRIAGAPFQIDLGKAFDGCAIAPAKERAIIFNAVEARPQRRRPRVGA